jgi:hypothetical protein
MSTVIAMRLNRDQAVLLADESTWHLSHVFGYRRTNYGDALTSLVAPEVTRKNGLAAIYCGVGFPCFQDEVARHTQQLLATGETPAENDVTSKAAYESFLKSHRRMVDDKLRFDYGFSLDQLNARRYLVDDEEREIRQASVIGAARATAAGSVPGNPCARIFSNQGLVVTRDREHGIQGWYLGPDGRHMGFTTPMAVIGDGSSLASHRMAEFLERRDVQTRRQGFSARQGLFIALRVAAELHGRVGTMGGYFQILFLDGDKGVTELVNDSCHLATEVLKANLWGFLNRADAEELASQLIFEGAAVDEVERELFRRVGEHAADLQRYLMGFKPHSSPLAREIDPPPPPPPVVSRKKSAARKKSRSKATKKATKKAGPTAPRKTKTASKGGRK